MKIKPDPFANQLLAWWEALQPTWRRLPDGKMSKDVPHEENWAIIRKGGSAGLYTVVMAASWWMAAVGNTGEGQDNEAVWDTVKDLTWILEQLRRTHTGSKRPLENDSDEATKSGKRRCVCFHFLFERESLLKVELVGAERRASNNVQRDG